MRTVLVILMLAWVPFSWQPLWGQAPGIRKNATQSPKQKANFTTDKPQIGTKSSPLIVETYAGTKSEQDAAEAQKNKDKADFINRWTLRFAGVVALFTGLLVIVGWCGVRAANRTLKAIEGQARLMETEIAVSHRAYLSLGHIVGPEEHTVKVFLENNGHVPARMIAVSAEIQFPLDGEIVSHRFTDIPAKRSSPAEMIVPGNANAFMLEILIPAIASSDMLISCDVKYDTGFESTDTLWFARKYLQESGTWTIASTYAVIDLTKDSEQKIDGQKAN